MKLALQIALPLIIWIAFTWLASDGFSESSEVWYMLLMPLGLIAFVGAFAGFILFVHWLY